MVFNMLTHEGMAVYRTDMSNLTRRDVSLSDVHSWKIADCLTLQEKELAGSEQLLPVEDTTISAPRHYSKLFHLVKFHSWAPLHINSDDISDLSLEISNDNAALGLTGIFQNDLSTFYGLVGYKAGKLIDEKGWRHSGHLRFVYSGLFPVIEGTFDFNDRNSIQYARKALVNNKIGIVRNVANNNNKPYMLGKIRAYIPLSFKKGGIQRGLIPSVSFSMTNDWFDSSMIFMTNDGSATEAVSFYRPTGITPGRNVMMTNLSASIRGYIMRPKAPSQTFPSLGIGLETGFSMRPKLTNLLSPNAYVYMYGYLPGLMAGQGFKLTALGQKIFTKNLTIIDNHTKIIPRGYSDNASAILYYVSDSQARMTADYAIPIYIGDISFLSPVLYATHFTLMPFADITLLKGGNIFSAGASLTLNVKNIACFPFDGEIGFRVSGKGGSRYNYLKELGAVHNRVSAEIKSSADLMNLNLYLKLY